MSVALATVIISSTPIATLSQDRKTPDQGSVKLNAELVQIDALVTDKAGKLISGLKREDFELSDRHKPQFITHFTYEERNTGREDNRPAGQPPIA